MQFAAGVLNNCIRLATAISARRPRECRVSRLDPNFWAQVVSRQYQTPGSFNISFWVVARSVLIFLGAPLLAAILTRIIGVCPLSHAFTHQLEAW